MSPRATSSWVMVTKSGVVDKSKAFAPTYPQMRNSDLRSSGQLGRLKIVSVFSLLKCKHALVKRENFQLIRATYAFRMKNNVSTEEGEHADEIFS